MYSKNIVRPIKKKTPLGYKRYYFIEKTFMFY